MEKNKQNRTEVPELTPVLLMCDFVDISEDLENMIDSPGFLPVCNIPLIQHALDNLIIQRFTNIFFCIKSKEITAKIESIVQNIYPDSIRMKFIIGHDYSTIMRSIDDLDYGFETFLIYPVNFLTNFDMKKMIVDYHEYRMNDKKIIMNIYMFMKENYANEINIYGFNAYKETKELLHYEKTHVNKTVNDRLFDKIRSVSKINLLGGCSSPRLCVVGKEVFALFSENYDYQSLDCLVESNLAINLYNYRFILQYEQAKFSLDYECIDDSLNNLTIEDDCLCKIIQTPSDFYEVNYYFKDFLYRREELMDMELFYNNTLCEYHEYGTNLIASSDLSKRNCNKSKVQNISDSIVGINVHNLIDFSLFNSIINHGIKLQENYSDCILFDEYIFMKKGTKYYVFKDNSPFLEYSPEAYQECVFTDQETTVNESISFHSEILAYLEDVTEGVVSKNIEISTVKKQVNLIAIVWKANSKDLIDVFTIFLSDFINQDDLNQSTIDISMFFPIIEGSLDEIQTQESFIHAIYKGLKINNKRLRKEAFVRIGYAMMDDGLIEKDILNNSKIIKGNFFQ